jgi:iron complex transport system permease protein
LWATVTGSGTPLAHVIVLQLRLPRFVLGSLSGAMLALSGTLLQGTLRNPLAGPELLGVTAGATVVVAAITILHLSVLFTLIPWLALVGAVLAGCIVVLVMRSQRDPTTLLLTGAAMAALLNAAVIVLISYGSQMDISLLFLFLVGSLSNRTWQDVQLVLPWAVVTIPIALALARPLNVLQLGDDMARGLGLPLERLRAMILLLASALVAGFVCRAARAACGTARVANSRRACGVAVFRAAGSGTAHGC